MKVGDKFIWIKDSGNFDGNFMHKHSELQIVAIDKSKKKDAIVFESKKTKRLHNASIKEMLKYATAIVITTESTSAIDKGLYQLGYNDTIIDRLYNWYCKLKGREFDEFV